MSLDKIKRFVERLFLGWIVVCAEKCAVSMNFISFWGSWAGLSWFFSNLGQFLFEIFMIRGFIRIFNIFEVFLSICNQAITFFHTIYSNFSHNLFFSRVFAFSHIFQALFFLQLFKYFCIFLAFSTSSLEFFRLSHPFQHDSIYIPNGHSLHKSLTNTKIRQFSHDFKLFHQLLTQFNLPNYSY